MSLLQLLIPNIKLKVSLALFALLLLSAFIAETKEPLTIFMIDDSTLAYKSMKNGNRERGWGQMLPVYFTEEVVLDNHAMNGRSSLSSLTVRQLVSNIKMLDKDSLLICFKDGTEITPVSYTHLKSGWHL